MSKKFFQRKVFWKDCSKEYCELTHLHGFKEFSLSSHKVEKLFWILIILGAITFTMFLIFKSIQGALNDKQQTLVYYEKYGNISLPLLYCPNDWIDINKMKLANISQHHLLYSLSYLRNMVSIYIDEKDFLSNRYYINVSSVHFCNITFDEAELPQLIFLAPYIETKCLFGNIPKYYKQVSTSILSSLKNVTMKAIDTSNSNLMIKLFEACQKNKYHEVWEIIYYQFPLSLTSKAYLIAIASYFGIRGISEKIVECGLTKHSIFLTLHDVDALEHGDHLKCGNFSKFELKPNFETGNRRNIICSMHNDAIIFYMFNGYAWRNFFCKTFDCYKKHRKVDERYSYKISEIISTHEGYSSYLMRNRQNGSSYETFKSYINYEIGGTFVKQNVELTKIRKWANEKFKQNEKADFYQYLTDKNFTIFDIFRSVSFDENKFLLGMSVDSYTEIRPRSGSINVEKVINGYGVCYLFNIKANMKPVTELPTSFNDINRRRKINEKLYVNIVELYTGFSMSVRPTSNVLIIGSNSKNLIANQNSFYVEKNRDWRKRYTFEISNLAYQSITEECKKSTKDHRNFTYTYNNCITNCFNIFSQPKYIDGFLEQRANCEYIAESTFETNFTGHCSYFTTFDTESPFDKTTVYTKENLDRCNDKCLKDCDLINFDVESSEYDCSKALYKCDITFRAPNVSKYSGENSLMRNYFENLPPSSNGLNPRPIWMVAYKYGDFNNPTFTDMIRGIADIYAQPIVRMEIQINSDVTRYATKKSFEWHSYLGVVGGQISLIVSGSLLTIFQLIWWCSRYFYRHYYRMTKPSMFVEQDLSVMSSLLDLRLTGFKIINTDIA